MWKNGDHTQVFSIIEIEMPFAMNALTKPSAKSQTAAGLVLFKKAADDWKIERKSSDLDLVNHWNNSKSVADNYEIFNNSSKQIEYETCLEESIEEHGNGFEASSVVPQSFWEIIGDKIENDDGMMMEIDVENVVILDDIELLEIHQEKNDEDFDDELVVIEEFDRVQSRIESGSGTSGGV